MDENDPEKGLVFDGRVTEDFKLDSGTWVSVGTLRAQAIGAASPLIQDCVVCGHDKPFVALLAWPNYRGGEGYLRDDATRHRRKRSSHSPKVRGLSCGEIRRAQRSQPRHRRARIKRVMLMLEPPSVDGHEITDKGYINQRATLERRKRLVDLLYENPPPPEVIEIG